jgi:hypothetical protein
LSPDNFEPLVVPVEGNHTSPPEHEPGRRPAWKWILHTEIEPLCAKYGLVIEYGDETDDACAIFYDDGCQPE